jgi:hypothetical protein
MERDHEPHPNFARGQEDEPDEHEHAKSDFARGQEQGEHDEDAESDFARGQDDRPRDDED